MSDEPENLTLRYLRPMDEKLDRIGTKLDEVMRRVGSLERTVAYQGMQFAEISVRTDGFERRLERIERRLDLVVEESHP